MSQPERSEAPGRPANPVRRARAARHLVLGRAVVLALALHALVVGRADAQSPRFPADPAAVTATPMVGGLATLRDELTRLAEITGALPARTRLIRRPSSELVHADSAVAGPTPLLEAYGADLALLPVALDGSLLSGYPDDRNNGLLWAGRGASALVRAGAVARWSVLSAGVAPELAYQQNRSFETRPVSSAGLSELVYPFRPDIDYPQRFGEGGFVSAGPGQSWVRVDAFGAAAGVSTENLWWGPAQRYPLLMSSSAPGFPHVFVGTGRPVDVWIGKLEAELVWARLSESDYFDERPGNDHPGLAALALAFSPRGLPGLSLGAVRVYGYSQREASWLKDTDPLKAVFGGAGVNREGNELFSIFGRWVFPESGAEVYAEWGRDDRWYDLKEFAQEPDHSQAYMAGFQKVTGIGDLGAIRVHGEVVAMQEKGELTRTGSRPLPVWYTNTQVTQGHTHRGQLLGAGGIGVGADAQFLAVDLLQGWGLAGLYTERVRRNDASPAAVEARRLWQYQHDTELTVGLRGLYVHSSSLSVSGSISWAYRYNRDFLDDDRNLGLSVQASWVPPLGGGAR